MPPPTIATVRGRMPQTYPSPAAHTVKCFTLLQALWVPSRGSRGSAPRLGPDGALVDHPPDVEVRLSRQRRSVREIASAWEREGRRVSALAKRQRSESAEQSSELEAAPRKSS